MTRLTTTVLAIVFIMGFRTSIDAKASSDSIRLTTVLNGYENSTGIRFSYDAALADQVWVPSSSQDMELQYFGEWLEAQRPFSITQVDSVLYAISTRSTEFSIRPKDGSEDLISLSPTLLINNQPYPSAISESFLHFNYRPTTGDSLKIYAPGYDPLNIPFESLLNSSGPIEFEMISQIRELDEVIIENYLTRGVDLNSSNQSIRVSTADLPLLPGETDGDLFASISVLPGISTPDNRPGNLFIRGSSTDQSYILFDDIPIYHRGHYFGTISPYNPKMVEQVGVHRSGFHPRLGGRVGGAIEIITQSDHAKPTIGVGANSLNYAAYVKSPLLKGKLGIALGGRRSMPPSLSSPKLSAISEMAFAASTATIPDGLTDDLDVLFEDYNARLSYQISRKHRLSLSAIYARTQIDYVVPINMLPHQNGFDNKGLSVRWLSTYSSRISTTLGFSTSRFSYLFFDGEAIDEHGPNLPGNYAINSIDDLGAHYEFGYRFDARKGLQIGVDFKLQDVIYKQKLTPMFTTNTQISEDGVSAVSIAPYMNYDWTIGNALFLQAGLRASYYDELQDFRPEPRLLINYQLSPTVSLKTSAGYYNQYLSHLRGLNFNSGGFESELWFIANKDNMKILRGKQAMIGALWTSGSWLIDLEGYIKRVENVNYYSESRFSPEAFFLTGMDEMRGIDFFIKREIRKNWSIWGKYSWTCLKVSLDSAKSIIYPSQFSQPHLVQVGSTWEWKQLKVSGAWKLASGQQAKNIDMLEDIDSYRESSSQDPPPMPPDGMPPPGGAPPPDNSTNTNPFEGLPNRYPIVHRLDISASYQLPKTEYRPFSLSVGVSLVNVYNQKNLTDQLLRGNNQLGMRLIDRNAIAFAPNLMIYIEW